MSLHPDGLLRWLIRCDACGLVRQVPLEPDYLAEDLDWLRRGARVEGWEYRDGRDLCHDCERAT